MGENFRERNYIFIKMYIYIFFIWEIKWLDREIIKNLERENNFLRYEKRKF